MALQIGGDGRAEWSPGNLVVSVGGGSPNIQASIWIDGVATGQEATLGADGTLASLTVVLFERYAVGAHLLEVRTADESGSLTITVQKTVPVPTATATPAVPAPPLVAGRWQFEDPVLHEIYLWPVNPSTASSPLPGRLLSDKLTTTGHAITSEGNLRTATWTLEGYFDQQAQYDAFALWAAKPYRIFITDDLGRQFIGVIVEFAPTPFEPQHADHNFVRSHFGMSIEVLKQVG